MKGTRKGFWKEKLMDLFFYFVNIIWLWGSFSYDQNLGFGIVFTLVIFKLIDLKYVESNESHNYEIILLLRQIHIMIMRKIGTIEEEE